MQQQLAMLKSSPHLMAPSSWPACNALTRLVATTPKDPDPALLLAAALQTTSLVSLQVDMQGDAASGTLQDISRLRRLTHLSFHHKACSSTPLLLAAIASCSSLRQLTADVEPADDSPAPDVPRSWSQLTGLTYLDLVSSFSELSRLTALKALQSLSFKEESSCNITLTTLYPLTTLTLLSHKLVHGGDAQDEADAGSTHCQPEVVPAAWREGLKELKWSCKGSGCLPLVAQLTSLTALNLDNLQMTPEACRCDASLIGLRWILSENPNSIPTVCSLRIGMEQLNNTGRAGSVCTGRVFEPWHGWRHLCEVLRVTLVSV
jgi:hypothetical protein